jgi:hypothetical protein
MFALQTVHNVCTWYITWLSLIYYGDAPDQALDILEEDEITKLSLRIVWSMDALLGTLRLTIADSIMVRTHPLHPAITINSHPLEGLEVLDQMQQQLDGGNGTSDM